MQRCKLWTLSALLVAFTMALPVHAVFASDKTVKKKLLGAIKRRDKTSTLEALNEAAALPGDKGAKLILSKALHIGLLGLVDEIVASLGKVNDPAPVIKAALSHRTADIRYLAVRALAFHKSAEARLACRKALKDKAEVVTVAAVRSTQAQLSKGIISEWIAFLLKEEKVKPKKQRQSFLRELVTALKNATGQEMDAGIDWENYWKAHRASWKAPEKSSKDGKDDVINRMKKHRKADVKTLARLAETDVIVLRGRSDKVETILSAIKIQHKRINRDEFDSLELKPNSVLVLNCNGDKDQFTDAEIVKISKFVASGGYLFSSDWQLKFTIEKAFPGAIAFGGESKRTARGAEIVSPITPVIGNHPYMRDVFPLSTLERAGYKWKIDGRSHLIKILSKKGVVPLIACEELKKSFKAPYVAVTFRWKGKVVTARKRVATGGKAKLDGGAVLHVLGHFKNQRDKSDKFALQQLLLNFILEKQRERRIGGKS
jgi:hypothetical protein